jgi:anti-sigma factor RsiW
MIDQNTALKLQAYVDGELPSGDVRQAAELLEKDPEAKLLFEELKASKSLLAGNELELQVPESREFYWSKIAREIARQESRPARESAGVRAWWLRLVAPAGAVAVLALVVSIALKSTSLPVRSWVALSDEHEIDTPLEETSSITFRSEAAGMTVVWVNSQPN